MCAIKLAQKMKIQKLPERKGVTTTIHLRRLQEEKKIVPKSGMSNNIQKIWTALIPKIASNMGWNSKIIHLVEHGGTFLRSTSMKKSSLRRATIKIMLWYQVNLKEYEN